MEHITNEKQKQSYALITSVKYFYDPDTVPADKTLELSNSKVLQTKNKISLKSNNIDNKDNIVEKGENAGNQHFLLFTQCFQKPFSSRSLERWIFW